MCNKIVSRLFAIKHMQTSQTCCLLSLFTFLQYQSFTTCVACNAMFAGKHKRCCEFEAADGG